MNYYKKKLLYETHWDKYRTMLKKQKKIILKRKFALVILKILLFFKGDKHND